MQPAGYLSCPEPMSHGCSPPFTWYGRNDQKCAANDTGQRCCSNEYHRRKRQEKGLLTDMNAERSEKKVTESDCMFLHGGLLIVELRPSSPGGGI